MESGIRQGKEMKWYLVMALGLSLTWFCAFMCGAELAEGCFYISNLDAKVLGR